MRASDPIMEADDVVSSAAALAGRWRPPFARVVEGFLDDDGCRALLDRITALQPAAAPVSMARGAVMRPDIRNNERVMFDDVALAASLFERARPFLPATLFGEPRTTQPSGDAWEAMGLNERFRGYRYRPGQRFTPHYDGCFARSAVEQSAITVLLYLDEGCAGGETRLLDFGVVVRPRRGTLFLFDHYVLHEGAEVLSGVKHVLRSDVMYRRISSLSSLSSLSSSSS